MDPLLEQANKPLENLDVRVPNGTYEFKLSSVGSPVLETRGSPDNQWKVVTLKITGHIVGDVEVDEPESWEDYKIMMGDEPIVVIDADITPRAEGSARSIQELRRALEEDVTKSAQEIVADNIGEIVNLKITNTTNAKGYPVTYHNFRKPV